jgi:GNAT superfamily N-acetyltransferase
MVRPYAPRVMITLREITEDDAPSVLALRLAPGQERFVSTVADSLAEAEQHPEGNPWFRAVHADGRPVGFVMLSWDVEPRPPEINGPWFLWKLLIDHRHQGKGYGREVVRQVVELVRAQGGTELLTSHVPGEGGPAGFYARLGFVATGDLDPDGEILLRRTVHG